MKKFYFLIFLCLSLSFINPSAIQKEQSIYNTLSEYGNFTIDKFDNFIGYNGVEYVIVYVNSTPFFLLNISKSNLSDQNSSFVSEIITENTTIEDVISYRRANLYSLYPIGELLEKLWPKIDKISKQISIKEIKYLYLTGLLNTTCKSTNECKDICTSWPTCSLFYNFNSSEILDSMLAFSQARSNIASIFEAEKSFRDQIKEKKDDEILLFYSDFFKSLKDLLNVYSNLKIQQNDSLFYAGPLSLPNEEDLSQSRTLLEEYLKNYTLKKESDLLILSIKNNTAMFAKKPIIKEKETQLENITEKSNASISEEQKREEDYLAIEQQQSNPKVSLTQAQAEFETQKEIYTSISKNLDLLLVLIALLIVLYSLGSLIIPRVLGSIKQDFSNQKDKESKERKLFSEVFKNFKKNKQRTLEDL